MLRLPFIRCLPQASRSLGVRCNSTQAPEKLEVFVDDQRVLVDPGTTVLQVPRNGLGETDETFSQLVTVYCSDFTGCRYGRCGNSSILLPRATVRRRQLQDVFGGSGAIGQGLYPRSLVEQTLFQ